MKGGKRKLRVLVKSAAGFFLLLILFGIILEMTGTGLSGSNLLYLVCLIILLFLMVDLYKMEMKAGRWLRRKLKKI